METDKQQTANARRVGKCKKEHYSQLRVSVRNEKLDMWKAYAKSKDIAISALVNQMFEESMAKDNFVYVPENSNNEED